MTNDGIVLPHSDCNLDRDHCHFHGGGGGGGGGGLFSGGYSIRYNYKVNYVHRISAQNIYKQKVIILFKLFCRVHNYY